MSLTNGTIVQEAAASLGWMAHGHTVVKATVTSVASASYRLIDQAVSVSGIAAVVRYARRTILTYLVRR
ncbi:MAG TPA: hypothetical protein ENK05_08825 [Gammaproteobacteria bacterium]|nr:hypothetical protein [Gammaproteobacteria bacterium]